MNILEANHLHKVYGDGGQGASLGLDRVSLNVKKGEFLAIMGPSGSGKTTLLNILSGIDKPTSGSVQINGDGISKMSGDELALFRRKQLGFVFQEFNLLDSLTVKENIIVPMVLEKKSSDYMDQKASEIMSVFGIEGLADKYPYNISGGQQQRAAVSRALVNDPSIIFADEPTGNLDSKSSKIIMECFEKVVDNFQTTILIVTHDVFAASYCHNVMFIKDGRIHSKIVRKGSREEFLEQIMDSLALLGGSSHDF
ncbi:ABC transporter ATP-binding protein [Halalkalibacter okhensis]|uniref:Multidrug ABC transporter ATP-binding protein n=1 Tax=Halalkalibacter okhensis TaxID=333138 RepID=A0A0B0IAN7_9BACI|nr:ABC transporter ATP-binding protein [Halalkalibacter okhensis]KHF39643.1 multidrug ABC transporter ATP-binding protein [Halalkalibacter okhensis]